MTSEPGADALEREVSPLELLFDLVFVLAVGQLTHHLVTGLTWRGAGETLVMLVAVCGIWAFTTFEVTLLDVERGATKAVVLGVMGLGLFMNAGIAHAFEGSAWLFVVPMVLALAAPAVYAAAYAPALHLRQHFRRVLVWAGAAAPFWLVGAALGGRLWCWAVAAGIDVLGTWTEHPVPGRVTRTSGLPFDAAHMMERLRLFLIILLGETVLSLGRAISEHHGDALRLALAAGGFVALVCLWAVYFGGSEDLVVAHTSGSADPISSVHLGINAIYGVFAGLVMLSAGIELVIADAHEAHAGVAGVLVLAGPMLYVLAQAFYFRVETGGGWAPRLLGSGVLAVGAVAAYWLPAYAVVGLLVVVVLALAVRLSRHASGRPAVG